MRRIIIAAALVAALLSAFGSGYQIGTVRQWRADRSPELWDYPNSQPGDVISVIDDNTGTARRISPTNR